MKTIKKIFQLVFYIIMIISGLSCVHHDVNKDLNQENISLNIQKYKLLKSYSYITPQKKVHTFFFNEWDNWFIPKPIKNYDEPEWLEKREGIHLKEYSKTTYISLDGSYEIKIPSLSCDKQYFSHHFRKTNQNSLFLLTDANKWTVGIKTSNILKDPFYTDYYDVTDVDNVIPDIIAKTAEQITRLETKFFKYNDLLIFEELVQCAARSSLFSFSHSVGYSGYFQNCPFRLDRYFVKNGYLYKISVYIEHIDRDGEEFNAKQAVYELSDFLLENIRFPKSNENK